MRKVLALILLVFFNSNIFAIDLIDKVQVLELGWVKDKNLYRLHLYGKAGAYMAPKKLYPCLEHSLKLKKKVTIKFDMKTFVLKDCKKD